MSYQEAFCNITTDLQACLENIDSYDRKRVLPGNWFTTDTTHLYQISNTGFVDLLFVENIETCDYLSNQDLLQSLVPCCVCHLLMLDLLELWCYA